MSENNSTKIYIPKKISPEETAIVSKILVESGQEVKKGQPLLEIETSKAIYEIVADYSDIVTILVNEGENIDHDSPVALLGVESASIKAESKLNKSHKIQFTKSSIFLLDEAKISLNEAELLFADYAIVTSDVVKKKLNMNNKNETRVPNDITTLIVGFGHRGRLLSNLLSDAETERNVAFLDYTNNFNSDSDLFLSLKTRNVYNLKEYQRMNFPKLTEVYWCVPNFDEFDYLKVSFEEFGSKIKSFIALDSTISSTAEIGLGVLCFPLSSICANAKIGNGVVIENSAIVGTDVVIGDFCNINNAASVAHGSIVGESSMVSDGARVAGNVIIGKKCLIGLNATINQKITIGDNVTINSGANVYTDIPSNSIYTNDGRIMTKNIKKDLKLE